jgi:hypothetical protein
MGLLEFFVSAAGAFGKLLGWLATESRADRERVATYFDQIAACMREVAERIEAGDPPRDTCARLAVYAYEFERILNVRYLQILSDDDDSIEDIQQKLKWQITTVSMGWRRELDRREALMAIANRRTQSAHDPELTSSKELDTLVNGFERELARNSEFNQRVQKIWDASGEFSALADALRVRLLTS